ncbi:MAG: hypothetical protein WC464_00705 [Bdellovibrionales bacterium]
MNTDIVLRQKERASIQENASSVLGFLSPPTFADVTIKISHIQMIGTRWTDMLGNDYANVWRLGETRPLANVLVRSLSENFDLIEMLIENGWAGMSLSLIEARILGGVVESLRGDGNRIFVNACEIDEFSLANIDVPSRSDRSAESIALSQKRDAAPAEFWFDGEFHKEVHVLESRRCVRYKAGAAIKASLMREASAIATQESVRLSRNESWLKLNNDVIQTGKELLVSDGCEKGAGLRKALTRPQGAYADMLKQPLCE